ncbi:MAG: GNAT family N-acetyltransferase [Armatimonadetes bacterium]|nr:GNAT family N-acetyltransferase [Armatimonadota bacterium]
MLVAVRKAEAGDVNFLVDLYERAYRGGYSACFDRHGAIGPQDFWWVQSEKEVHVVEVNRRPAGMMILGRHGGQLLVEEMIGDLVGTAGRAAALGATDGTLLRRLHEFVARRFRQERQDAMLVRTAEVNPLGLAFARVFGFAFTNALIVMTRALGERVQAPAPDGYAVRRAAAGDEREIVRVYQESFGTALDAGDVQKILHRPQCRAFVAERESYRVGFVLAEVRGETGEWILAVREPHRRRGVGRALAGAALEFFRGRKAPRAAVTFWGLDAAAEGFCRRMGYATERVYLYFEKRL